MNEGKYIVFLLGSRETMLVFSAAESHVDIWRMIECPATKLVSAGMITTYNDGPSCSGKSITLGIDSRPRVDTVLARFAIGYENC